MGMNNIEILVVITSVFHPHMWVALQLSVNAYTMQDLQTLISTGDSLYTNYKSFIHVGPIQLFVIFKCKAYEISQVVHDLILLHYRY